ncbi:MAG: BlaI/MecI/CopY family transcriptional regulator [Isosphaeraceae bacterium]
MTESARPSEAELAILQVLWERGPSTVREVFDQIGRARGTGYPTVLKLMQIMATKGIVARDESRRSHVYRAQLDRNAIREKMTLDLLDRVFNGSGRDLVLHALSARKATTEEIAEIRSLLDHLEKDGGSDGTVAGGDH